MPQIVPNISSTSQSKAKIFIIEPDFYIRESISLLLEGEGYLLDGCDGKEPMKYIKGFDPRVVIIDFNEISGIDFISHMLPKLRNKMIKVILISTSAKIEQFAEQLGVEGFLRKPFDTGDIIKKIESVLKERSELYL